MTTHRDFKSNKKHNRANRASSKASRRFVMEWWKQNQLKTPTHWVLWSSSPPGLGRRAVSLLHEPTDLRYTTLFLEPLGSVFDAFQLWGPLSLARFSHFELCVCDVRFRQIGRLTSLIWDLTPAQSQRQTCRVINHTSDLRSRTCIVTASRDKAHQAQFAPEINRWTEASWVAMPVPMRTSNFAKTWEKCQQRGVRVGSTWKTRHK